MLRSAQRHGSKKTPPARQTSHPGASARDSRGGVSTITRAGTSHALGRRIVLRCGRYPTTRHLGDSPLSRIDKPTTAESEAQMMTVGLPDDTAKAVGGVCVEFWVTAWRE